MFEFYRFLQDGAIYIVSTVVLLLWIEIFFYNYKIEKNLSGINANPGSNKTPAKSNYFTIVLITIFAGGLLYYLSLGNIFFVTNLEEVETIKEKTGILGELVPDSFKISENSKSFLIRDDNGSELEVIYYDDLNSIRNAKIIAASGIFREGKFEADSVLVARNAIYTVLVIVLIVWLGIVFYLYNIEKKSLLKE